jgi:hypothetical protein
LEEVLVVKWHFQTPVQVRFQRGLQKREQVRFQRGLLLEPVQAYFQTKIQSMVLCCQKLVPVHFQRVAQVPVHFQKDFQKAQVQACFQTDLPMVQVSTRTHSLLQVRFQTQAQVLAQLQR